jgi:N6-adenosine-specific RNA methylase IME4
VLWLWATAPLLPQAMACMKAWGFQYATMGCWVKRTANGKMRWGTGYRLRSCHEPFLIGIRGEPKNKRDIPSVLDGLAREHSRKPDIAYVMAERMLVDPGVRKADVFSREKRPGWEAFGNELEKFAEAAQ